MLNFSVKTSSLSLSCSINHGTLSGEGLVDGSYKLLKFQAGDIVQGEVVTSIKDNGVATKDSFYSLKDFIVNNSRIEVCFRIEKEGLGPYSCTNVSSSFRKWVAKQCEIAQIRRWNGEEEKQPSLYQDPQLNTLAGHVNLFNFAFSSYEQLWNWFSFEEVQMMIKEGFEIIAVQKGRDYFESFHSAYQVLIVKEESNFNFLRQVKETSFLPYY